MSETITKIEEVENQSASKYGTEQGYKIHTTEQVIELMIDNDASCCEVWGYFMSEDDLDKFVGATLQSIKTTDTNRLTSEKDLAELPAESDMIMFVDLETDRGVLQFVAYNEHNGYYGHEAYVRSRQLTASEVL